MRRFACSRTICLVFVCVEPATLFRDEAYVLAPGESHIMRVCISAGWL
ncbi:MAG: hypothetical protein PHG71_09795 [Kiritimatiellae bacterium]|nr:hypothetical protein [Kiritimatiellia bacterium]MDD4623515.1 hypothetical protein [Kiritimatiellia bacterium]